MSIAPHYVPLIGSIAAALVAGGVAFVVAVLSKELKTSEFRQAWIDALRTDIAEMTAHAQMLSMAVTSKRAYGVEQAAIVDYLYSRHDDFVSLHTRYNRILLRLNPAEHVRLIAALGTLALTQPLAAHDDAIISAVTAVRDESNVVLKAEWDRVKKGEPLFRWTKRVAFAVAGASAAFLAIYLIIQLSQSAA